MGRVLQLEIPETQLSEAVSRFFWITYRYDFSPINGTAFTSDAGWGCMIRSGQMLAASAIASTVLGETRKEHGSFTVAKQSYLFVEWLEQAIDPYIRKFVISNFLDETKSPLSLHNIIMQGVKMGKAVGEWHAPSITAHCINNLINEKLTIGLRSYCVMDMTVDISVITKLLDGAKVLIWLPMRLGVDSLNPIYLNAIKKLLKMPQSLGIAGGRPNSSLYFIGYSDEALLYLDPHYCRPCVQATDAQSMTDEVFAFVIACIRR